MTAQEVADLFRALELDLVASLQRNMKRHIAQEKEEGGKNNVPEHWEAWQAAKLRDMQRFRTANRNIVAQYSSVIDKETKQMLQEQYAEGGSEGFFSMNDRKVNALIGEMQHAQQASEKAALRYMDDVYRQTIRKTALGMATGSMTLKQAVDDATKDFLRQGIQCIRYKNGRQVNIASYAEMALRTASTRATLLGEAALRETLGVDTVLVSQYGACSDTCLPWQGLVYIDDVFQVYNGPKTLGGTYGVSRNGKQYPLLSVAMKAGLFHPNCRHTLTTWFEGVSTRPKPMDKAKIQATSRLEAKQRAMERQIRQAKREAEGLQDEQAAKEAKREVRRLQKKLKAFVDTHGDVLRRDPWRERYDGVSQQWREKAAQETVLEQLNYQGASEQEIKEIEEELAQLPPKLRKLAETRISSILVEDNPTGSGYNPRTKEICLSKSREPGAVIHEYAHALEVKLNLYKQPRFLEVLHNGLENISVNDIIIDDETFMKEIFVLKANKFVSYYQGRLYENFSPNGIYDGKQVYLDGLREYFSEGFRFYYINPNLLKEKDLPLYKFIEGMIDIG